MNCYPEMNKQIVSLLRVHDNPAVLYAADRIEELEAQVARRDEILNWLMARIKEFMSREF
jgi:hypothetical protein